MTNHLEVSWDGPVYNLYRFPPWRKLTISTLKNWILCSQNSSKYKKKSSSLPEPTQPWGDNWWTGLILLKSVWHHRRRSKSIIFLWPKVFCYQLHWLILLLYMVSIMHSLRWAQRPSDKASGSDQGHFFLPNIPCRFVPGSSRSVLQDPQRRPFNNLMHRFQEDQFSWKCSVVRRHQQHKAVAVVQEQNCLFPWGKLSQAPSLGCISVLLPACYFWSTLEVERIKTPSRNLPHLSIWYKFL